MSIDDLLDSLILQPPLTPGSSNAITVDSNNNNSNRQPQANDTANEAQVLALQQQLQKLCTDLNTLRCENDSLKTERRALAAQPPPAPANTAAQVQLISDLAPATMPAAASVNFPWKQHISTVEECLRNKQLSSGEAILKVLVDASQAISCEASARVRLMTQLGRIQVERGDLDTGLKTLQQALNLIESSNIGQSMEAAFCLDALAQCAQQQNDFEQGEKLRRQAVVIGEDLLGAEHPDVHGFRDRLDKLRQDRNIAAIGQDEASKTLLDKLTAQYNEAVANGLDPAPAQAASDNYSSFMVEKYTANGKTALNQKNIREAESQFRSAVEKAAAVDNADPRKTEVMLLLAGSIETQGRDNEAREIYEAALTIAFLYIGWNDIQVAQCLACLAEIHRRGGQMGLAKNYFVQAIGLYSLISGKEDPNTVLLQSKYNEFLDSIKEDTKWKGWSQ